jgi:hypothetical protein
MNGKLSCLLLAGSLILGSAVAVAADSGSPSQQGDVAASWTPRKLRFTYTGFTRYTCDGLLGQMKSILQRLGASADLEVRPYGCTQFEGPEASPGVEATFSVLEPATGGGKGEGKGVAALWEKVTLHSDTTHRFNGDGNCELIEQVKKSVLPLFAARDVDYSTDCYPHADSLKGTHLSAEVLRPVKPQAPEPASR